MTAPILTCPDFSKPFTLFCDASAAGLGSILTQNGQVVAYASRSLSKQKRKYSTTELECLAVLWSVEKFRGYFEGYRFTVVTDHASLLWLDNLKEPTGRLGRWAVRLQQFDYEIVHKKGKEHQAPDALSRSPLPIESDVVDIELVTVTDESLIRDEWYLGLRESITRDPDKYPSWRVEEGGQILKLVVNSEGIPTWNRVVPKDFRDSVLYECHDSQLSGHFGVTKTLDKVRRFYYWPKMRGDVKKYVSKSHVCLSTKSPQAKPPGFMGKQKQVDRKFQVIASDLIGPFPKSLKGFMYVIVTVCTFTKFVCVRPIRRATAEAVHDHLLNDVFLKYGVLSTLVCDNGAQYKSRLVNSL